MAEHPIVHIEIWNKNPKKASEFLEKTFGWKIDHDDSFDYYQFSPQSGAGGGLPKVDDNQGFKAGDVLLYIGVDDINAALKKIEENGGKVLAPMREIPGIGHFAIFADDQGTRLALYKSIRSQV